MYREITTAVVVKNTVRKKKWNKLSSFMPLSPELLRLPHTSLNKEKGTEKYTPV